MMIDVKTFNEAKILRYHDKSVFKMNFRCGNEIGLKIKSQHNIYLYYI